jgi:nucleoid DNA-binding protein
MIKVKIIEQDVFNIADKETRSRGFVVKPIRYNTVKAEKIIDYCASSTMVPKPYVAASMEALSHGIQHFLLNGHSVEIPGLGIFNVTISYKTARTSADAGLEQVKQLNVRFLPCRELKEAIGNAELELEGIYALVGEVPGLPNADGTPGEPQKVYQRISKNSDYVLDDDETDTETGGGNNTGGGTGGNNGDDLVG